MRFHPSLKYSSPQFPHPPRLTRSIRLKTKYQIGSSAAMAAGSLAVWLAATDSIIFWWWRLTLFIFAARFFIYWLICASRHCARLCAASARRRPPDPLFRAVSPFCLNARLYLLPEPRTAALYLFFWGSGLPRLRANNSDAPALHSRLRDSAPLSIGSASLCRGKRKRKKAAQTANSRKPLFYAAALSVGVLVRLLAAKPARQRPAVLKKGFSSSEILPAHST